MILFPFMPIILSFLVVCSSSALFLKARTQTLHMCRATLLEVQQDMAQSLEKLLSLNPKATSLRKSEAKIIRQIQIAAVSMPQLLPMLQAKLILIQAQQLKLRSRQKSIIQKTEKLAENNLANLSRQILSQNSTPHLAVYATPLHSLSPNYEKLALFTHTQKITATWEIAPHSYLIKWLLQFFKPELPPLKLSCGATIKEANRQWKEKLALNQNKDRFL